jgi:hypothetical protein
MICTHFFRSGTACPTALDLHLYDYSPAYMTAYLNAMAEENGKQNVHL